MNTFSDPHTNTYLTRHPFIMPKETGGQTAISVTTTQYGYLNSVYTILILGIVSFAWEIVSFLVLIFFPTERFSHKKGQKDGTAPPPLDTTTSPLTEEELIKASKRQEEKDLTIRRRKANRYVALIAVWNSTTPSAAGGLLLEHAFSMCCQAGDLSTGIFDMIVIYIAFLVFVGQKATGTLVPSHLRMGNLVPARPESIFYAIQSRANARANLVDAIKIQQMRAPATQRAIGIVESARQELKKKVNISPRTTMPWLGPGNQTIEQITYDYKITGLDFGLQLKDAVNFIVSVQGACTLEYGWINASDPATVNSDVYVVFDQSVYVYGGEFARPVGGSVELDARNDENFSKANRSYAIVPDTVGRSSTTASTDVWYRTQPDPSNPGSFVVRRNRPALSCWQNDVWSYRGNNADSILNLSSLPGLDLPPPIRDEIIPSRLTSPMINEVASQLGNSILVASTGSLSGVFNANISSYANDFERLILASYVASLNIFLDTTLISPNNTYGLVNSALDSSGKPKDGVNKFVLQSPDVVTLSPKFLIMIPLIWFGFWVLRAAFAWTRSAHRNSGKLSRLTLRAVALQPVQLYRILDEELSGFRDDWSNRRGHLPFIRKARPIWSRSVPGAVGTPHTNPQMPAYNEQEPPNNDGGDYGPKPVPDNDGGDYGPTQLHTVLGANGQGVPEKGGMLQRPAYPVMSTSADEISTVGNGDARQKAAPPAPGVPARTYTLFAAPKVVETPDGNFNLRFTGPMPYEKHQNIRSRTLDREKVWSWRRDHGDRRKVVADDPDRKSDTSYSVMFFL